MIIFFVCLIAVILIDIIAVDLISRYSCDRYCPKLPKFIAMGLIGKNSNKKKKYSRSRERADRLKNTPHNKYKIYSNDKLKLVGHYFHNDNSERIILAIHGWRSTWNYDFNGQYQFLMNNNCSILFIESRAHGESEGRYMYYGKKERFDVLLWIKFIRENISADLPIYIYGMSVGATTAIMASSDINDPNVLGIIADSASTSARDAGKITIKNIHLSPTLFYSQVRLDCRLRLKMDDNEYTALEALKTNKIPILIINGTKDRITPEFMAEKLYSNCLAPKTKVTFANAGHMKSFYADTGKYQAAILDFIKQCET